MLPSETAVIALGVAAAGSADPRIVLLIACAAAGAFLGDNLSYLIGRRFGPWAERRFFASGKGARSRAWAERALHRFGMQVIIVCRFIPGGRTGGHADLRAHRLPALPVRHRGGDLGAVRLLHRPLGGKAFEDKPWVGFLAAFGGTVVLSAVIEASRRIRSGWKGRPGRP